MKKKLGGYQILDLTSIEIEELENYTTITDADILQTLYEYLLPIVLDPTKELKPIYLRAVSDSGRSTVLCELSQHDAVTFYIVAKLSGGTLRIGVGFEQDEETLEWVISSGWQYLTEQTQIEGGAISTIKAIETGTIKDVIGLDEDGEPVKSDSLIVKTISQTQANWGADMTFVASPTMASGGIEVTNIYNRLEVIGNILYVVVNIKLENTSENDYVDTCQMDQVISIPEQYGEKIFDLLGKSVKEIADDNYVVITGADIISLANGTAHTNIETSDYALFLTNRNTANNMNVFVKKRTNLSINAGHTKYLTGRIALTLL